MKSVEATEDSWQKGVRALEEGGGCVRREVGGWVHEEGGGRVHEEGGVWVGA